MDHKCVPTRDVFFQEFDTNKRPVYSGMCKCNAVCLFYIDEANVVWKDVHWANGGPLRK